MLPQVTNGAPRTDTSRKTAAAIPTAGVSSLRTVPGDGIQPHA